MLGVGRSFESNMCLAFDVFLHLELNVEVNVAKGPTLLSGFHKNYT